ncbi:LmbU family transcriptional regulator [Streptomyces sp. C184]|uniref:LmbU family transcriptional regulator n=1 Tax=Streptomyces sp. C184 TaxID=3237121 RepID=UPI0034C68DC8
MESGSDQRRISQERSLHRRSSASLNGHEGGSGRSFHDRLGLNDGVYAGQVALRIPDGLPFESWRRLGQHIKRISDSSAWWLADWLVYGEEQFPDRYQVVIEQTSLSYQTLRNYTWVARKFPASRRRDTLSLQHHAETAALPVEEQDGWLERAERENWSARRLRQELRGRNQLPGSETRTPSQVTLNLDSERRGRWMQAAEAADVPLMDWIVQAVDRAATR